MVRWFEKWGRTVLCLVALAVLIPLTAAAQTCPNISLSIPTGIAQRYGPGPDVATNIYPTRPQNLNPQWINYSDCAADIHLQFTLTASGLPCSDIVQAWVGPTDCTQLTARQTTSGSARCWPVSGPQPISQTFTMDIRARDIVAYISNEEPPVLYSPVTDATACQSQAEPGGTALALYFMAIEANGQAVDGNSAIFGNGGASSCAGSSVFGADLVGPYPPTGVTAGVGENIILVNWTPATDSTIQGFNIYCQPQGSVATDGAIAQEATLVCAESGTTTFTDGSTDATPTTTDAGCQYVNLSSNSTSSSNCVSSVLTNVFETSPTGAVGEGGVATTPVDGSTSFSDAATFGQVGISNIPNQYLCGTVGGNYASSYVVTNFSAGDAAPIMDGTEYAVAVAAFDGSGNTGIIGNLACVVPSPVIDFWAAYTEAGGLAGGGFCSLRGPPSSSAATGGLVSTLMFGLGSGGMVIGLVRRRRRRRLRRHR